MAIKHYSKSKKLREMSITFPDKISFRKKLTRKDEQDVFQVVSSFYIFHNFVQIAAHDQPKVL